MSSRKQGDEVVIHVHYKAILSVICAILLIISFVAFIFFYNLNVTVANPKFYKKSLQNANVYERLINDGIPAIITSSQISQDAVSNMLVKNAIIFVIQKSIPLDWVQSQTEKVIDEVALFFTKQHATPKAAIQLDNLDTYLTQIGDGLNIVAQLVPSCASTSGEPMKLLNVTIDCKNMSINLDQIKASLQKASSEIAKVKVTSVEVSSQIKDVAGKINKLQSMIKNLNTYMWVSFITMILMVVLIAFMQHSNIYKMIKYLSISLIIGSVILLVFSLFGESSSLRNIGTINLNIASAMNSIIVDFAKSVVSNLYLQIKIISGIILIISVGTYIYAVGKINHYSIEK